MQKTNKSSRLLMAAAIFFVIGALLFCGGMFALDWDFNNLDTNEYIEKSWINSSNSDINSLELKVSGRQVVVNSIEDGEANAEWFDTKNSKVEISLNQGKLTVKEKFYFTLNLPLFNINRKNDKLIVNIPVDSLGKLDVSLSGGTLDINGIKSIGKISYNQSGGRADFGGGLTADSLDCRLSGGTVKFNGITLGSMNFDQSGGTASFDNSKSDYLKCDKSGGTLNVAKLEAGKIDVKISGGKMIGSVAGRDADYTVTVSKSGGKCNINEKNGTDAAKWIKIKQSGGTISLSFE